MSLRVVTRRKFLKGVGMALGGAVLTLSDTGCVASSAPVVLADVESNRIRIDTNRSELVNVGDGIQLYAEELEYPILLIKVTERRFVALSTACMHLGCTVKKQPSVIRCACHGSVYDLEGKVLNGPSELPLLEYAVQLNGTIAEIQLQ